MWHPEGELWRSQKMPGATFEKVFFHPSEARFCMEYTHGISHISLINLQPDPVASHTGPCNNNNNKFVIIKHVFHFQIFGMGCLIMPFGNQFKSNSKGHRKKDTKYQVETEQTLFFFSVATASNRWVKN